MKFRRKAQESVDINLAPLIDVVFILLLFFVVTTTFTRETQLKVDLPEAASGTPPQETALKQLEVLIGADGSYALNGRQLRQHDLQTLMAALQAESQGDNSLPLVISADAQATHQAVITAMDAAGKLGFAHLRITTVEAQIKSVPTQSQITELIAKLSRTEAQMHGMQEQIAATYRRTENIEAYLLQKK